MAQQKRIHMQCNRRGFDPWVGRSPGEGNDDPLQYSCLENPMDTGAKRVTGHGITGVRHNFKTKQ